MLSSPSIVSQLIVNLLKKLHHTNHCCCWLFFVLALFVLVSILSSPFVSLNTRKMLVWDTQLATHWCRQSLAALYNTHFARRLSPSFSNLACVTANMCRQVAPKSSIPPSSSTLIALKCYASVFCYKHNFWEVCVCRDGCHKRRSSHLSLHTPKLRSEGHDPRPR